ncbi:hypothetical protein RCH09_003723 [Actimicrobium sp. GrIS 1.19]|uniref:hypothetical protein n=1 Tax=Actimicrobium sp. GrIS 1.19 TaxID=3071708 RepID=UPI002DFB7E89|nr:hypothetical protein [Actimicrobium sp. GrIS 1.19]
MNTKDIIFAILILIAGSVALSGISAATCSLQTGKALGIESTGFDVLAHEVFGSSTTLAGVDAATVVKK